MTVRFPKLIALIAVAFASRVVHGQTDPAAEPSVLAVAKAMPAVVNINTERVVQRTVQDPYDQLFNQFFGGQMRRPRVLSQKVQSLGSGFIVDPAGFIVTNEHVVQRAAELKISVTTNDGKTYTAHYVTGSTEADLAFLKIDTKDALPFINLADLSPNLLGETVLVLGNPLGYGSSVARGILSAKNRTVTVDEVEYHNLIQTDAAINPGNSGGPVVDISGKLVGVSSVKMAFTPQGVPTQGLGFAIPAEIVRQRVDEFKQIAAGKKVAKPAGESAAGPEILRSAIAGPDAAVERDPRLRSRLRGLDRRCRPGLAGRTGRNETGPCHLAGRPLSSHLLPAARRAADPD